MLKTHTISIFVRNVPGVLVRVAEIFARRGYNIDSLVVSPGVKDEYSRMTITCTGGTEITFEQMIPQLDKLVDVVHAEDHTNQKTVETEIALIKINVSLENRTSILQIVEHYNAKIVDYTKDSLTAQVHGVSEKLDCCIDLLKEFEITELIRSGKIVISRGKQST